MTKQPNDEATNDALLALRGRHRFQRVSVGGTRGASGSWGKFLGWLLFASAFLGTGAVLGWEQWRFRQDSTTVTGTVARKIFSGETQERTNSGKRVTKSHYVALVEYCDAAGRRYEIETSYSRMGDDFDVGTAVPIRYPNGRPEAAIVDSFSDTWLIPTLLGIPGLLILLVALGKLPGRDPR